MSIPPIERHGVCLPGLRGDGCARRYMFKLLRCTCLHCFSLKMEAEELGRYRRRLALLAAGRLVEAAALETGGGTAAAKVRPCGCCCYYVCMGKNE